MVLYFVILLFENPIQVFKHWVPWSTDFCAAEVQREWQTNRRVARPFYHSHFKQWRHCWQFVLFQSSSPACLFQWWRVWCPCFHWNARCMFPWQLWETWRIRYQDKMSYYLLWEAKESPSYSNMSSVSVMKLNPLFSVDKYVRLVILIYSRTVNMFCCMNQIHCHKIITIDPLTYHKIFTGYYSTIVLTKTNL